jgi:hypothetical protein
VNYIVACSGADRHQRVKGTKANENREERQGIRYHETSGRKHEIFGRKHITNTNTNTQKGKKEGYL